MTTVSPIDTRTIFNRANMFFKENCGTGSGGFQPGNTCAADDGPSSDHNTISVVPYSQQKLESAIDQWVVSNGGTPELKWTREKGFQELPPLETIEAIASEQQSYSGKPISAEAKQSYDAFKKAIYSQFEAIQKSGLKVHAWKGEGEPYKESEDKPWSPNSNIMRQRVEEEKKFYFFMTQSGFGAEGAGESTKHPLLEMSPFKTDDGDPMLANDVFRVVHDSVGHLYGKFSFSTRGEMNAMLSHASTLPKEAHAALFAETFGQNAVYEKTGKYADQNTYVSEFLPEIERMLKSKTGSAALTKSYSPEISDGADSDYPLGFGHIKRRPTGWDDAQVTGDDIASTIFVRAAKDCGANAKGGHGFQPGNTCGANGGFLNDSEIDKQSGLTDDDKAAYLRLLLGRSQSDMFDDMDRLSAESNELSSRSKSGMTSAEHDTLMDQEEEIRQKIKSVRNEMKSVGVWDQYNAELVRRIKDINYQMQVNEDKMKADIQWYLDKTNEQPAKKEEQRKKLIARVSGDRPEEAKAAIDRIVSNMTASHIRMMMVKSIDVMSREDLTSFITGLTQSGQKLGVNLRPEEVGGLHVGNEGSIKIDHPGIELDGILAHELAHQFDKRGIDSISRSPEWVKLWQQEAHKISHYAENNPAEGFAEFWRGVWTEPHRIAKIAPNTWEAMKKWGHL